LSKIFDRKRLQNVGISLVEFTPTKMLNWCWRTYAARRDPEL
jgi:hypothetical protein